MIKREKMKNNMKKITMMGMASLLALTLVASATFAWFVSKDTVVNHLEAAKPVEGKVQIFEMFEPPDNWTPGQRVVKQVHVINHSTTNVFVRASFEEIMTLLKQPKSMDKPIDDPSSVNEEPVIFDSYPYWHGDGLIPWVEMSKSQLEGPGIDTPGLRFRIAGIKNDEDRRSFNFVVWYDIKQGPFKGKSQRVTADFKQNGSKFIVSNIKYLAVVKETTKVAWADFGNDSVTGQTRTLVKRPDIIYAQSDKTTQGKKLTLFYRRWPSIPTVPEMTTPVPSEWFYNEDDGFFYFIDHIYRGIYTGPLISYLDLAKDAGPEYGGMAYDLIVQMQAIENTNEALTSSTGWGLSTNSAVYKALKPYVKA